MFSYHAIIYKPSRYRISLFMDDRYSKKQLFQCHSNDSLTIDDQPLHQNNQNERNGLKQCDRQNERLR